MESSRPPHYPAKGSSISPRPSTLNVTICSGKSRDWMGVFSRSKLAGTWRMSSGKLVFWWPRGAEIAMNRWGRFLIRFLVTIALSMMLVMRAWILQSKSLIFDSYKDRRKRKILTVWKGKFWQFWKGKFWQFWKGKFWQFEKGKFWQFEKGKFWQFEIGKFWQFEKGKFWQFEIGKFLTVWKREILTVYI